LIFLSTKKTYLVQLCENACFCQDVGYIFYNDEKPLAAGGGVTEKYGHTKGLFHALISDSW